MKFKLTFLKQKSKISITLHFFRKRVHIWFLWGQFQVYFEWKPLKRDILDFEIEKSHKKYLLIHIWNVFSAISDFKIQNITLHKFSSKTNLALTSLDSIKIKSKKVFRKKWNVINIFNFFSKNFSFKRQNMRITIFLILS